MGNKDEEARTSLASDKCSLCDSERLVQSAPELVTDRAQVLTVTKQDAHPVGGDIKKMDDFTEEGARKADDNKAGIEEIKEEEEEDVEEEKEEEASLLQDHGWAWFVCLGCFLAHMLTGGFERSDGVMFLEFSSRFQQSAQVTALPAATCATLRLFMGPVATAVSNRLSVRASVMAGALVWACSLLISGYAAENLVVLFFSYGLLQGIGRGLIYSPSVIIVGLYFHRRRGLGTGLGSAGVGLGTLLMPPFQEWLFQQLGFRGTFLVLAAVVLNGCVVAALYRPLSLHRNIVMSGNRRKCRSGKADEEEALCSTDTLKNPDDSHKNPDDSHEPRTESTEGVTRIRNETTTPRPEMTGTIMDHTVRIEPCSDDRNGMRNDIVVMTSGQDTQRLSLATAIAKIPSCSLYNDQSLNVRDKHSCSIRDDHSCNIQDDHSCNVRDDHSSNVRDDDKALQASCTAHKPICNVRNDHSYNMCLVERMPSASNSREVHCHARKSAASLKKSLPSQSVSCIKSLVQTCFPTEEKQQRKDGADGQKLIHWSLLKTPSFLFYCLSISLFTAAFKSAFTFLPALAQSQGMSSIQGAYLLSITGVLDTLGRVLSGWLMDLDRLRPIRPLLYNGVIFCIVVLSLASPFLRSFWELAALFGLYGMLTGTYVSQKSVILVDILGKDSLASSFGLLICFQGLGSLAGPILSGLLKDVFGRFDEAFFLGGAAMALSGLLMIVSNIYRIRSKSTLYCKEVPTLS